MPQYEKVVIVGVGLLGGSIGMALRSRGLARQVIGVGRDAQALQSAVLLGAVSDSSLELEAACEAADLVVVCTPVLTIPHYINRCLASSLAVDCLVTDVGSTKAGICAAVEPASSDRFCGSHPIAGSDRSGVAHASSDLFERRLTVVTPTPRTPEQLTARVEQFWQSLGSRTKRMSPVQHDQAIAKTSHLPHLVAAILAESTDESLASLLGRGWQDTTRVAAGNVEMWEQIIAENRQPVLEALREYSDRLQDWIHAIESEDVQGLSELLQAAKHKRESILG